MTNQQLKDHLISQGWKESTADIVAQWISTEKTVNEWRDTFVGSFLSDHPNSFHVLRRVIEATGKKDPDWSDFTAQQLRIIRDYISTEVTNNSVRFYMSQIKATLNLNADKVRVTQQQLKAATHTKAEPTQHVALTEEELERIHRYVPRTATERDVKREFMIEAYCGARNSDVQNLSLANVSDGWLTYVSQKTRVKTSVPVHRNLLAYLTADPGKPHAKKVIIETIQRICRAVGIDQPLELFTKGRLQTGPKYSFIGSHTARRSFASQLAVRGVPIAMIAKFMGHSSTDMTMRYICLQTDDIPADVKAFFN